MKPYSIIISNIAEEELKDALTYLSNIQDVLSTNFGSELKSYSILLAENPFLFKKIQNNYRKVYMKKFKYTIVYEIYESDKKVVIWAIMHHSRDPQRWMSRIKNTF